MAKIILVNSYYTNISDSYNYLPISTFSNNEPDEKILNYFNPILGIKKEETYVKSIDIHTLFNSLDIKGDINQKNIKADIYLYKNKANIVESYPLQNPESYPVSYAIGNNNKQTIYCEQTNNCYYYNYIVLFEYEDYKYSIYLSAWNTSDIIQNIDYEENKPNHSLEIKALNPQVSYDLEEIKLILKNMFEEK